MGISNHRLIGQRCTNSLITVISDTENKLKLQHIPLKQHINIKMPSRIMTSSSVSPSEYSMIGEKNTSTISSLNSFMVSSLASLAMVDNQTERSDSPLTGPAVMFIGNEATLAGRSDPLTIPGVNFNGNNASSLAMMDNQRGRSDPLTMPGVNCNGSNIYLPMVDHQTGRSYPMTIPAVNVNRNANNEGMAFHHYIQQQTPAPLNENMAENNFQGQNKPRVLLTRSSMLTTGDSMDVEMDNNTTYLTNTNNTTCSSVKSCQLSMKKTGDLGIDNLADYDLGEEIPMMLSMIDPSPVPATTVDQRKSPPSMNSMAKPHDNWKEYFDRFQQQKDPCSSSSVTMESEYDRSNKVINDMPHMITLQLIRSLDNDDGWEELADAMGFNFDESGMLETEAKRGKSPSRKLLWQIGCRGGTVQLLHDKLLQKRRITDAELVANYILRGLVTKQAG